MTLFTILFRYDKLREAEEKRQEQEDEAYVQRLFGEQGDVKVKRLADDDGDDSSDDEKRFTKRVKTDKATDLLGEGTSSSSKAPEKKEAWQKSIGTLGGGKKNALGIVKKGSKNTLGIVKKSNPAAVAVNKEEKKSTVEKKEEPKVEKEEPKATEEKKPAAAAAGLSLLAAYSDSSSEEDQ